MSIDQDTDTDTGSGIFWMSSISSLTLTINVALDGELMTVPLLPNDKGTHTSLCVNIAGIYHTALRLRYLILFFFCSSKSCEH